MAHWLLAFTDENTIAVVYVNRVTGATHDCGAAAVTVAEALEWVVDREEGGGAADPGDVIFLPDGTVLPVLRPRGQA